MDRRIKKILASLTQPPQQEREQQPQPEAEAEPEKGSHLDEDLVIAKLIKKLPGLNKFCVDIGASDGISMSNTYKLYKAGWDGLAIECIPEKFTELSRHLGSFKTALSNSMVTPENVLPLLRAYNTPKNFGFLSLDIDGYDYFVLQKILSEYSPTIICAEINEKIPVPIKFTVKYEKNYFWNTSHYYGQSLAQLDPLCKKHDYALAKLHYNNAFYVKKGSYKGKNYTASEGYSEGYLNQPDRKDKFPWNADFEVIYSLPIDAQIEFINAKFKAHKGKYIIRKN